jgi:hypothetical protein
MKKKSIWGVVIDCENVSHVYAEAIFQQISQRCIIRISGSDSALKPWQPTIQRFHLSPQRHKGGKNAADRLLLADVWAWFKEQHLTHFVFVTHDGGFAEDIRKLRTQGCICYVIGIKHISKRLKRACSRVIHVH